MGNGHHQVFFINQVGDGQVATGAGDFGTTLVTELGNDRFQLFPDHLEQPLGVAQDVQQIGNLVENFLVFVLELLGFQTGQAVQTQVQNGLGLFR